MYICINMYTTLKNGEKADGLRITLELKAQHGCEFPKFVLFRERTQKSSAKQTENVIASLLQPNTTEKICRLKLTLTSKVLLTKTDAQLESCKLSFIWGKMRTAAQKAAPQIALRDCSKEVVGEGRYIQALVKGEFSANKRLLYKRFSPSHKDLMLP